MKVRCAPVRCGWRCGGFPGPTSGSMAGATHFFWGRRGIGMMADDGHHGEGEHDQRDMAMPAMPGAGFVVIEAEFVLGGLEAVLDRPAMPFHLHQRLDGCVEWTPGREEGEITFGDIAADQQ